MNNPQNDQEKFLKILRQKVIDESHRSKEEAETKLAEDSTIEALEEVSGLSRQRIEEISDQIKYEQTQERERAQQIKARRRFILTSSAMASFVILMIIGVIRLIPSQPTTVVPEKPAVKTVKAEPVKTEPKQQSESPSSYEKKKERIAKYKELIKEIKAGDTSVVEYMLRSNDIDPNELPPGSRSPIYWAVYNKNNRMVKVLLENGVDPLVNMRNYENITALYHDSRYNKNLNANLFYQHIANRSDAPASVKTLWNKKIPYSKKGFENVIDDQDLVSARLFLDANTGKFSQTWFNEALIQAARTQWEDFVDLLIEENVKTSTESGNLATRIALENHQSSIANKIIKHFPIDASARILRSNKESLLNITIATKNIPLTTAFLESGAKPITQPFLSLFRKGRTHEDIDSADFELIDLLLSYGFEPDNKTLQRLWSMDRKQVSDRTSKMQQLIDVIKPHIKHYDLNTQTLNQFARDNDLKGIKSLISDGVEPTTEKNNVTLIYAIIGNSFDTADYLLSLNPDFYHQELSKRDWFLDTFQFYYRNPKALAKYLKDADTPETLQNKVRYIFENDLIDFSNPKIIDIVIRSDTLANIDLFKLWISKGGTLELERMTRYHLKKHQLTEYLAEIEKAEN